MITLPNNISKMRDAKTLLAKLLATENVQVRHSTEAQTAAFDIENRVLILPIFKNMEDYLYDMLVGHEVGHALWTIAIEWRDALDSEMINQGILNIVEDARIEKKIKRLYPGITRCFIQGYRDLVKRGFFGNTEYSELNFIDRINLHFKCGDTAAIPFNDEELPYVDLVREVETFEDTKRVAKILQMAYVEEVTTALDELQFGATVMPGNSGDPDENTQGQVPGDSEDGEEDESDSSNNGITNIPNPDNFNDDEYNVDDEEFSTDATWENRKQELNDDSGDEYQYFGLPKPVLKDMIIFPKQILKEFPIHVMEFFNDPSRQPNGVNDWSKSLSAFNTFRSSSQKIINYMVKEFERKKAAQEYRRSSIAKTGVLDVNKLFSYKYNDDLFLKNTIQPDGKNHGLVMLLDWSASMDPHMHNTIKQLLSLVWFCQKVNIPFEVYAFTSAYRHKMVIGDTEVTDPSRMMSWKYKENDAILNDVHLLNLFSNKMRTKQLNEMAKWLFTWSYDVPMGGYRYRWCPMRGGNMENYSLSSTPLVESFVAMQTIIPAFKKDYKLDVVNLITLTDGDGNSSFSARFKPEGTSSGKILRGYAVQPVFFDPKTYREYKIKDSKYTHNSYVRTEQMQELFLLKLLKDRYGVNLIGIYLEASNTIQRGTLEKYLGWYSVNKELFKKHRTQGRKDGFITLKDVGYDEYYLIPTGRILIDDHDYMENVTSDMKAGKIKTAFAKNQNRKFGNRVLVNRMMDLIC